MPAHAPFRAVAFTLVALGAACGRPPEPAGRASTPILDGTEDTTNMSVVAVDTMLPTGEELCSGYLVMPDLVLTARHCVAPVENSAGGCSAQDPASGAKGGTPLAPSKLLVSTDDVLSFSSEWLEVAEVIVLPGSEGAQLCGRDLALLRLSAPLADLPLIPLSIDGPPAVGDGFTAVGYGVVAPSDLASSDRRRSRADLSVESVGETARTVDEEWNADTGPCGGDSGSPALDAAGASFGVMSRGPKSTCKSMIYERLDPHADFLVEQAQLSAGRLGVPLPVWAGGASGGGGAGGAGGAGGTGGAGGANEGAGGDATTATADDDTGCAVATVGQDREGVPWLALTGLGVLAVSLTRWRRRGPS